MGIHRRLRPGELPFQVWCLCVTTFISRAGTMALLFLVVYLLSLGISEAQAGLAVSVYGIGSLIAAPLTGYICDRLGPLTVTKVVLFIQGFILLMIPFAAEIKYVLCLILFWSLAGEALRPASTAFIGSFPDEKWRGAAFGLNRIATNVGMSIGPALGGVLIHAKPAYIFVFNGAASMLAGAFLTYSCRSKGFEGVPNVHHNVQQRKDNRKVWSVPHLVVFLVGLIPAFCVFYQYRSTMAQYFIGRQILEPYFFGLLLSVNAVLVLILQIPVTLYLQKGHETISMVVGAFLVGAGFGAFIFVTTFLGAALCVVIWTLGQIALLSGSEVYVSRIGSGTKQGQYAGLYHMAINLAAFVGPGLGSLILERSAAVLWGIMFTFGSLSALVLLRVTRQTETKRTPRVYDSDTQLAGASFWQR